MRSQKRIPCKSNVFNLLRVFTLTALFVLSFAKSSLAVDGEEVYQYLTSRGYNVAYVNPLEDTKDWVSTNNNGSHTVVYVENDAIVGHQDVEW